MKFSLVLSPFYVQRSKFHTKNMEHLLKNSEIVMFRLKANLKKRLKFAKKIIFKSNLTSKFLINQPTTN